jgi:eukaryotic-like serine/threonine-protein kinase
VSRCPTTGLPVTLTGVQFRSRPKSRPKAPDPWGVKVPPKITGVPARVPARLDTSADLGSARDGDSLVGALVDGKYLVSALIGRGGMSEVYEATHRVIGRKVAIKVVNAARAGDRVTAARLIHEAQVVSALRHPNICEIHDIGELPDRRAFVVLERLYGMTLRALFDAGGPLGPHRTIDVAQQLLSALGAAHAQGVIHRDVKPENVFLVTRPDGPPTVKLLDFGISKSAGSITLTRVGSIVGTPPYMSPEQLENKDTLDPRTDLWGVGVILYEALSGEHPFRGASYHELADRIMTIPHRPLQLLDRTIPTQLAAVVDHALAKSPNDRIATAASFQRALTRASKTTGPRDERASGPLPDASSFKVGRSGLPVLGGDTAESSESDLRNDRGKRPTTPGKRAADTRAFPLVQQRSTSPWPPSPAAAARPRRAAEPPRVLPELQTEDSSGSDTTPTRRRPA